MITEWFLQLAGTVMTWFVGLLDGITVPAWLPTLDDTVNGILANVGGLGAWFPWAVAIGIATTCALTYFVCLLLKYGRAIFSYVPFFGGAG